MAVLQLPLQPYLDNHEGTGEILFFEQKTQTIFFQIFQKIPPHNDLLTCAVDLVLQPVLRDYSHLLVLPMSRRRPSKRGKDECRRMETLSKVELHCS